MDSVKFAVQDKSDENTEYLLQCVQAIIEYAQIGQLAVADCVVVDAAKAGREVGDVVPVLCAMIPDKSDPDKAAGVLPLAQLFPKGSEPSEYLAPYFVKDDNA